MPQPLIYSPPDAYIAWADPARSPLGEGGVRGRLVLDLTAF
jgi:hypothetical protein